MHVNCIEMYNYTLIDKCIIAHSMAIPIAILDCDLLLHGRGHKTLDRFDLDSVPDNLLLTQFGFPREFILYLVEILREVSRWWACISIISSN